MIKKANGFYFEYTEVVKIQLLGEEIQLYSLVGIFNARLSEEVCIRKNNGYQFKIVSIEGNQMYRSFMYYLNDEIYDKSKMESHRALLY